MELSTKLEDQQRPKLIELNQEFQATLRTIMVYFLIDNSNALLLLTINYKLENSMQLLSRYEVPFLCKLLLL